jgi:translation initiation factor 3 subunit F
VLLHVLDHHNRRHDAGSRVIGTLLGRRRHDDGGGGEAGGSRGSSSSSSVVVEVTGAFAVPHAERGDEVAIGKDFNRTMLGLHLRGTAPPAAAAAATAAADRRGRQQPPPPPASSGPSALSDSFVVGWYASAGSHQDGLVQDTSSLIHEFYAAAVASSSGGKGAGGVGGAAAAPAGDPSDPRGGGVGGAAGAPADPIHLVVDTRLLRDEVQVRAYRSSPVVLQGEALGNLFHELPLSLECTEPEAIVLREMTLASGSGAGTEEGEGKASASAGEGNPKEELQASMERLQELVSAASGYVDRVVSGEVTADPALGREIADALSSVPAVDAGAMDGLFHENLQDLLMVSYLSSMAQAQITLAEKLNAAMG